MYHGSRGFRKYPYQNLNDLNLDFVLRIAREAAETLAELGDYKEQIKMLEEAVERLESGELSREMAAAIIELVQKNIIGLVGEMVKFVFFGLTDDGYFVAHIPEPWDSILFNTTNYDIFIEGVEDFGRLVLSY